MANIKPVIARYRRLTDKPFRSPAITLQEAVAEAMHHQIDGQKVSANYQLRKTTSLAQTQDSFVLAAPIVTDSYFFCELARFEEGANIPLCWANPDASALVIGQQKPGAGREALLGVLQFMIIGNHVILIESGGIRTGRLEEYLTWLLKDRVPAIPRGSHLTLDTEFDVSTLGGADLSDVKEVALRPIGLKETQGGGHVATVQKDAHESAPPSVAREILGLMGNTEADIDTLLAEVPAGGDVELRLSLFFKKGRGKGAANPSAGSARRLFRNMDDEAIELKTAQGRTIGKMTALARNTHVAVNGSVIDFNDAARVLWETFEFWVSKGKFEP